MTLISARRTSILTFFLLGGLLLAACNFPGMGPTPDLFATSAAQTVSARLTQQFMETNGGPPPIATTQPPPPPTTEPPPTAIPTTAVPTLTPTVTQTQIPCDRVAFVKDVTIPDGEELSPGENFTKTWRLKNNGSCTWSSSYSLVFDHGDSMDGPPSKQLTSGTVAPGDTIDVSVDLTAPASPGTFKGFWKLRNGSGVIFGIGVTGTNPFWVEIEVVPVTTTMDIDFVIGESGQATSTGTSSGSRFVGDNGSDSSSQAFISFNISGIPADATITKVVMDVSDHLLSGDPFGDLGCMFVYKHNYGALDAGDYVPSTPSSGRLNAWCTEGSLDNPVIDNDILNALQSMVGSNRFKVRFQFNKDTNNDAASDWVIIDVPKLKVTYYTTP